ncbi:hypothetical protein GCM10009847_00860 [Leucobacter tardus]|uniref:Helix-turn-helix domain-containing protein n=1 Tax=Leucobacter tardus TaxID=501483 RepID=A0A939QJ61_9MICO|nr:hypothetical protein [Leucobacter tardus]MBO2990998.1 hypothetical protein [Leucobacter tardus]
MEDALTVAVRALIHEETRQLRTEIEKLRRTLGTPPALPKDEGADGDDDLSGMPKIMTTEMLAGQFPELSRRTLEDWRTKGVGPMSVKADNARRVYYLKSDVIAWIMANRD